MPRPKKPMPTRECLEAMWLDHTVTVVSMAQKYGVSDGCVMQWAKRFGFGPRQCGHRRPRGTAPPIQISPADNHCRDLGDGPDAGDPTPSEIAIRAARIRADHLEEKRRGLIA